MEKKQILLAEDNPHTRFLVNAVLQTEGYEVIEAKDGQEAKDLLLNEEVIKKVSVIFLDILMPHINGLDLLSMIKNDEKLSALPVIMLTTRDMAEDLIIGYTQGADYYIPKPFTRQQLLYGLNLVLAGETSGPVQSA